ncbi:MAG: TRAP transporter substrate-binding protein [Rhodospirillales bacterium]|nr:TRAP transporter substrate-binding protein [Rhodospirillales bacterium]
MLFYKKSFIFTAVIFLTTFFFTQGDLRQAEAKELKMATFMSAKHPVNKGILPHLAKNIASETGGSLKLKLYPSGQLGKGPKAQYKRVIENVAEITFGVHGYTPKLFPRTMTVAQPGVGNSSQEVTKKAWSIYDKHLKSEYAKVKVLGIFANWPAILITRKNPVSKIGDIKGLKIRAPSPSNIPQLRAWGAAAVYMPVTKAYNSLQTGVLDGVYISPGALYRPWRLAEPGEYVTAGMNGPTTMLYIFMNKQAYEGLSSSHKKAINKHSGRGLSMFAANYWGNIDAKQLATAKNEQKGVKFIQLSQSAAAEFNNATAQSVEQFIAKKEKAGIPARAIYKAVTQ